MENTNAKIYSEVDGVINAMAEEYRSKVPKKLKDLILKHKDNSVEVKYNMNIPLNEQGISKEALSMVALIHLNYWCKNEEEKKKLNRIFKENAIKNEENESVSENMQMVEYKENIFKKIFNYVKNIFLKKE